MNLCELLRTKVQRRDIFDTTHNFQYNIAAKQYLVIVHFTTIRHERSNCAHLPTLDILCTIYTS